MLLEPDIEYDHLIQVMDAIRSAEVPAAEPVAEPAVPEPRSPRPDGPEARRGEADPGRAVHRHRRRRRAVNAADVQKEKRS